MEALGERFAQKLVHASSMDDLWSARRAALGLKILMGGPVASGINGCTKLTNKLLDVLDLTGDDNNAEDANSQQQGARLALLSDTQVFKCLAEVTAKVLQ